VADRQRRCIECRRGYDRARAGTEERTASKRRHSKRRGTDHQFAYRLRRALASWEAVHGSF
jgi:hypothetical protein